MNRGHQSKAWGQNILIDSLRVLRREVLRPRRLCDDESLFQKGQGYPGIPSWARALSLKRETIMGSELPNASVP